ncbi:hypothetical protein, partial [uncultured Parabacteroides sp.]|uniref:hypothetical protein n=1 Tax=uncultured Parabacteroides sp. TaxID=512312 RepID=UPI00263B713E
MKFKTKIAPVRKKTGQEPIFFRRELIYVRTKVILKAECLFYLIDIIQFFPGKQFHFADGR